MTQTASSPARFDKLKRVLSELFQFDQADLDFGIYRIMNAKREEITRFLDVDLLPQVQTELAKLAGTTSAETEQELKKLVATLKGADMTDDEIAENRRVQALRVQIAAATDVDAVEAEVYNDLANFFKRYYEGGDFLSLRRYKEGVYAIPYEGEEVKLHWANADQYYIKSSESFRDYTFTLEDDRRVHFKLVSADTEAANNKAQNGKDRRFVLADPPLEENQGELVVRFRYEPSAEKQKKLNEDARSTIFSQSGFDSWLPALKALRPSGKDGERTLLDKQLNDYTAKNSFDYFVHKDLRGFLRRELDFYIKNEILHLDDLEAEGEQRVLAQLSKVKAMRSVAHKIIDLLAQIENFQKKLWLKKKFVVRTDYCVTLDKVLEMEQAGDLLKQIAVNDKQRETWVSLFAINEIEGYSELLTEEFLRANPFLVLDTQHFDQRFKDLLLSGIEDIDATTNGVLIKSENFQALNLLQTRYKEQVKCIYIDPPYNTGSSSIPYKNDLKHSSWTTMMYDRLALLQPTLQADGAIFASIDKTERFVLENAMSSVFGSENKVEELIWAMNTNNSQAPNYSTNHEYVLVYAKDRQVAEQDRDMFREPKPGYLEVMELIQELNPHYPSVEQIESAIRDLYQKHRIEYREEVESQGLEWDDEKGNDPWKGLFNYSRAEYRDADGKLVLEKEAAHREATIWIWQEGDMSMPSTKQAPTTRDPDHPNYRFYNPPHPLTGLPTPHPKRGWNAPYEAQEEGLRSFRSIDADGRIAWGADEKKTPRIKRMLHEVESNVGKSLFVDYSDGEKQTSALFGRSGVFLAPKHSDFVSRFILHAAKSDSTIIDCFGGSGSSGHAVIRTNREDGGSRKYVLVEMGEYFDTVLKPRIEKVIYSKDWKDGKPVSREGSSHMVKVLRLESYEDALNNIALQKSPVPQGRLDFEAEADREFKEDYTLSYMLDVESRGSASLLNIDSFASPFDYKLQIASSSAGETLPTTVDLVETFNYLLGLKVKTQEYIQGFKVVTGETLSGEQVLIIWRNLAEKDNTALDSFFKKQDYNPKDMEFDLIYVNGDNNLQNLRREDETWKVRLIEEAFRRLMFEADSGTSIGGA